MYSLVRAERTIFDKNKIILSKSIAYIYWDDVEHLFVDCANKTWGEYDKNEWKHKGVVIPDITSHNEDNVYPYNIIQYEILETLNTYYYGSLWDKIEELEEINCLRKDIGLHGLILADIKFVKKNH